MNELVRPGLHATGAAPDLIIDARLALADYGLLMSLRLARSRRVWLVPSLWFLLERTEVIDYPEFADEMEDARAYLPALRAWHAAWSEANLLDSFYWIGDYRIESRLPPDFEHGSMRRLQHFAAALESRAQAGGAPAITRLAECARDAAALAAVNGIAAPVILTVPEPPPDPPRLCRLLTNAGVPCQPADPAAAAALQRAAGFGEGDLCLQQLIRLGARLAMIHLVAPHAPVARSADPFAVEGEEVALDETSDPWVGAGAIWHDVGWAP